LNQFITRNPSDARGYEMRAIFRLLQGKESEAASDFKKSIKLEPALGPEIRKTTEELSHISKVK